MILERVMPLAGVCRMQARAGDVLFLRFVRFGERHHEACGLVCLAAWHIFVRCAGGRLADQVGCCVGRRVVLVAWGEEWGER